MWEEERAIDWPLPLKEIMKSFLLDMFVSASWRKSKKIWSQLNCLDAWCIEQTIAHSTIRDLEVKLEQMLFERKEFRVFQTEHVYVNKMAATCTKLRKTMLVYSYPDVDECSLGSHNCNTSATCADMAGTFSCTCFSGFTGDGTSCTSKLKYFCDS